MTTWPRTMSSHLSERDFEIFNGRGELVGAASSRWLLIDVTTGRVTNVTPEIAAAYALDNGCRAWRGRWPWRGRARRGAEETFTYTALRRDLDMFRHVNNLHYLELAREALPEAVLARSSPRWKSSTSGKFGWGTGSTSSTPLTRRRAGTWWS